MESNSSISQLSIFILHQDVARQRAYSDILQEGELVSVAFQRHTNPPRVATVV